MMKKLLFNIKKLGGCVYRPVKEVLKNQKLRKRTRYAYYYKFLPIQPNMILYESFFGRGMLCNPYAIFLELLSNDQYKKFIHVWVIDNFKDNESIIKAYASYKNVIFVKYQGKEYLKYLCRVKYLINNVTFPSYFTKKENQIYINTWHGIPLKTLGFDMPNGSTEVSNTLRNFLHTDYLISASPFLTQIYHTAFKLDQIYEGKIIEAGYPRLDILFHFERSSIIQKLQQCGINVAQEKKLFYTPPHGMVLLTLK